MAKLILTYRDYGEPGERSTVSAEGPDFTALNHDAEITLQNALRDAIDDITLGTRVNVQRVAQESPGLDTNPASPFAQRESKWLVRYRDTVTGKRATMELPCADLSKLLSSTPDKADLADADVAAFVAAFEAYVLSPGTGTRGDTEVYEIRFVGRRT